MKSPPGRLRPGGDFSLTVVWAYGGVLLGLHDLRHAHRQAVSQGPGALGAAGTAQGALGIAGRWRVASTTTEIATLSGGAKFNASVA